MYIEFSYGLVDLVMEIIGGGDLVKWEGVHIALYYTLLSRCPWWVKDRQSQNHISSINDTKYHISSDIIPFPMVKEHNNYKNLLYENLAVLQDCRGNEWVKMKWSEYSNPASQRVNPTVRCWKAPCYGWIDGVFIPGCRLVINRVTIRCRRPPPSSSLPRRRHHRRRQAWGGYY